MTNQPNLESASDEPLYNIGIVSRMTGVPVATLRVWERRYGFPHTQRTPGGHRLCSEKEVIRLRWVKARVDEGMQTHQAIRALQHLEQEGRFPDTPTLPVQRAFQPTSDPSLTAFHHRLVEALTAHDLPLADQILAEVLPLYPLEDLILSIVSPAMHDLGEAWHEGEITVATEHMATHFLRQHLLMWMNTGPLPYPGIQPVVLACAPEEWHEGSILILGVLLRRLRWPVAYLGQNVPLEALAGLARQMRAPAVVFVAMTETPALALAEWPRYLPDAATHGRPLVCYGGGIFTDEPAWRERVPGLFLGETLGEGIQVLNERLRTYLSPGS